MVEIGLFSPLVLRRRQLLAGQHRTSHADVHGNGAAPAMPVGTGNPAGRKVQRKRSGEPRERSSRELLVRQIEFSQERGVSRVATQALHEGVHFHSDQTATTFDIRPV